MTATEPKPDLDLQGLRSGSNRDLGSWGRLWQEDREFPIESHRGFAGRVVVFLKKALRGLVRAPQADLWERQRAYNLVVQEQLEEGLRRMAELGDRLSDTTADHHRWIGEVARDTSVLGQDLQKIQREMLEDLNRLREVGERELKVTYDEIMAYVHAQEEFVKSHDGRLTHLESFHNDGYDEVKDHTVALFTRLDEKLDRYRELSRERWGRLSGLLAVAERTGGEAVPGQELARAVRDEKYLEFEARFRGSEEDIRGRLDPYLDVLGGRTDVLDLGCGRGEALAALAAAGIKASGVDANVEMVERCREKGLEAEVDDLFRALEARSESSLGGVVSFHVIEHLPAAELERLVRLAWRVLRPGGVLVLETPNPTSLVVGASRFWLDPTHKRPVHPESLKTLMELNGFDPVERIDLQPFAAEDRLPEIDVEAVAPEQAALADRMNAIRDRLDELLFGFQDYGLVGHKPA